MSKTFNENELILLDTDKQIIDSFTNNIEVTYPEIGIIYSNKSINKGDTNYLEKSEFENKNLKEQNILLQQLENLKTEKAILELNNNKYVEKLNFLLKENSRLKAIMENYEHLKMKVDMYEKINFQSLFTNSINENQKIIGFSEKLKTIEADYLKEIIELKNSLSQVKFQIDYLNAENQYLKNSNSNIFTNNDINFRNSETNIKKNEEIENLKTNIAKAGNDIALKDNEIAKLNISFIEQKEQNFKLTNEINVLKLEITSLSNNNLINLNNTNNNDLISKKIFEELKSKYSESQKSYIKLQEELEDEKTKYVSLLQMNQDLGKKIIENMKVMSQNKSEITYLKKKVAEQQKEKGDIFNISEFEDITSNYEMNLFKEDKKKADEIRLNLEKLNQEQKIQIADLEQKIKEYHTKVQSLTDELNLEKMENENLKEIQKSDLKNISRILSEQNSNNQIKKNEEQINELKISLQNTNKINQELTNQKTNLEKEISDMKNKLKEQQNAFLFLANEKDHNNPSYFKDDKSQAAFSRYSMASNLTQNKFFDSKIKDLEESLIQEKENSENLLKIKQNILDKLKKSNDNLLAERNKILNFNIAISVNICSIGSNPALYKLNTSSPCNEF